jgi:hypothetical protein
MRAFCLITASPTAVMARIHRVGDHQPGGPGGPGSIRRCQDREVSELPGPYPAEMIEARRWLDQGSRRT